MYNYEVEVYIHIYHIVSAYFYNKNVANYVIMIFSTINLYLIT